jgi:hypothetical protein
MPTASSPPIMTMSNGSTGETMHHADSWMW